MSYRKKKVIDAAGLFSKRSAGLYPPQMRKLLGEVGVETITSITVSRVPVASAVRSLLNLVSGGTYDQAVKASNYDSMFHLALVINGKYTLDKQAVVKFVRGVPTGGETRTVDLQGKSLTIQQFVDATKLKMGASNFSNYDAHTNNCQVFVKSALEASGLLTPELQNFVMQDADAVFSKMPQFAEKAAKAITDVGAVADKLVEGEGIPKWKEYYKQQTKGKKFGSRQAVNDHMRECSKKYRTLLKL